MFIFKSGIFLAVICWVGTGFAQNHHFDNLTNAKRTLQHHIYTDYFKTVYCEATYDKNTKKVTDYPAHFNKTVIAHRSENIEYEHIVPVEAFGHHFDEWRYGHPACQNKEFAYKGRKCAEKTNKTFAYMQADMYNLYPAIGSVNALRLNRAFDKLPDNIPLYFHAGCAFKIADNLAEPPERAKGIVARTYLYFSETYPTWFQMTPQQLNTMIDWHIAYPVSDWECQRTYRIEQIQNSQNLITRKACQKAGLWPTENQETNALTIQDNNLKKEE